VVVVDMRGRVVNDIGNTGKGSAGGLGLREGEMKLVSV
jgi:hypothetical protein